MYVKLMTKDNVILIWGVKIYIDWNIMTIHLLFAKKKLHKGHIVRKVITCIL
jgi:hypothetical protein